MRTYQIATLHTDPAQYAAMRASFEAAGFVAPRARFTPLDNSAGNRFDPYAVLAAIAGGGGGVPAVSGDEAVVILCHQDVRLDLGDGLAALDAVVDRVDAADPNWAVLGNAGVNYRRQQRWWLDDPGGRFRTARGVEACQSLDENFLVLSRRRLARPTAGLSGFHLYATDAVLNAAVAGRRSYVVPFLLTHLSVGKADSPEFRLACRQFEAAWTPRLVVGIVTTSCAYFKLSRWAAVRWLLDRWRARAVLAWCGLTLAPAWWDCLGVTRASSLRLQHRLR